ncbi:MAG TPA: nicotinamide riboside transporter PnuC [Candidatus Saccharimonadales bacterium]|nr:nicotinamide riboside transporter PnuC [Candidatus Saccharimonadales bacterium]
MKKLLWGLSFLLSGLFILASMQHWVSFGLTEVLGFVTGGYCVWLAVVENIWNWPIGILNAVAFTVLFLGSRLYADAGLQIVYIVLGFVGWYWWLKGGEHKSELKVQHIGVLESLALAIVGIVATVGFTRFLASINDVAPFWDGLTTVSSLVAQYMLTRKYLENWYVWIATDVIYIGLYGFKHLALTAVLYVIFLTMCLVGVRDWRKSATKQTTEQAILKQREA